MSQVSIIVPVYNVEKYLKQCLDSIINQTFKDIEIIIVNDCSTDGSLAIIKQYQKKDSRINLINHKKNIGVSKARNEGIKAAKSKYISFVDSDDWVREDYVETLFNDIEKHKCDVFIEGFITYNNKTSEYRVRKFSFLSKRYKNHKSLILLPSPNSAPWSRIYNKSFLLENNLNFHLKACEDSLFFYKLILANPKIVIKETPIYFYRVAREESITSKSYFKFHHNMSLLREIAKFLNKKNLYLQYCKYFYVYSFILIAYILTCSKIPNKKKQKFLLVANRFLFNGKRKNFDLSELILRNIFKFFLKHARLYTNVAIILKATKRLFSEGI
jgi:glycosyltransferase involved in cell wall biosynthesis